MLYPRGTNDRLLAQLKLTKDQRLGFELKYALLLPNTTTLRPALYCAAASIFPPAVYAGRPRFVLL